MSNQNYQRHQEQPVNEGSGIRLFLVVQLFIIAAIWGVVAAENNPQEGMANIFLFFSLIFGGTSATWCVFDARSRGINIVPIVQYLIFFTWILALPVYLVYSRGKRGLILAVVNIAGMLGLAATTFAIANGLT